MVGYKNGFVCFLFLAFITFSCFQKTGDSGKKNINKKVKFCSLDSAKNFPLDVKELVLRGRRLDDFPNEIFNFKNLEYLDLSMNLIDSIPNEIKVLKKLKFLAMAYGTVRSIPTTITELKNLEELILLENSIQQLPDSICNLQKLQNLNLIGNELSTLPQCLCSLESLKMIGLSYHKKSRHISKEEINKLKTCLNDVVVVYREMESN